MLIAGGAGPTVLAVNQHTTHTKVLNILLVLAAIYLVSSLVLRSPLGGLYVITPIAASMVLLFGLLGWIGHPPRHGLGLDPRHRRRHRRRLRDLLPLPPARGAAPAPTTTPTALHAAMQTSGRAVIFVAASIGAGFAAMGLFSRFFGLRLFGTLMPLAMAVSCIAALSLMPVLVLRTRPAFIFGRRAREKAPAPEGRPALT